MLGFVLAASTAAPAQLAGGRYVRAELIASTTVPRPGSSIVVGLRMTPQQGWHGYWSNPGESGLAPSVRWAAPAGVRFGPLLHPAPTLLQSMGIVSYVHSGPHVLLSRVSIGRGIAAGTPIPVTANLSWAACSKNQCVPEHATLSLQMVAGDGASSPDAQALERALAALPGRAPRGRFSAAGGKLILELPAGLRLDPRTVRFYPDRNGYFDPLAVHVTARAPIRLEAPLADPAPDPITGVVSDGTAAYRLEFTPAHARASVASGTPRERGERPLAAPAQPISSTDRSPSPDSRPGLSAPPNRLWLLRALLLLAIGGFALFAFALAKRPYR